MRFDKFTTNFQQAFADAQSLAVGNDNPYIEPQHLLVAAAEPGRRRHGVAPRRAPGSTSPACAAASKQAIDRLPEGRGHGRRGQRLPRARQPAQRDRQGSAEARRPVHRLRAVPARAHAGQGRDRAAPEAAWRHPPGARAGDRRRARRRSRGEPGGRGAARGAQEIHPRSHRARPHGQARPGHRARRRDPARHPDPAAPHQEQPGADRRAGRGQDRDRRRARAAHRQRRSAGDAQGQARARRSTWRRSSPAPSTAASSRSG